MQLTFKRHGYVVNDDNLPPAARKVKEFLDAIPEDKRHELLFSDDLASAANIRPGTVNHHANDLPAYTFYPAYPPSRRACRVWGHPDAIAQLKAQGGRCE